MPHRAFIPNGTLALENGIESRPYALNQRSDEDAWR
jgi:hypothetical protein